MKCGKYKVYKARSISERSVLLFDFIPKLKNLEFEKYMPFSDFNQRYERNGDKTYQRKKFGKNVVPFSPD